NGRGGKRGRASAGLDFGLRQYALPDPDSQPDPILANLVHDIADSGRVVELADISWIRNVVGYLATVHNELRHSSEFSLEAAVQKPVNASPNPRCWSSEFPACHHHPVTSPSGAR